MATIWVGCCGPLQSASFTSLHVTLCKNEKCSLKSPLKLGMCVVPIPSVKSGPLLTFCQQKVMNQKGVQKNFCGATEKELWQLNISVEFVMSELWPRG